MGAVSTVDDGLKRFYKYKPGREVENFDKPKGTISTDLNARSKNLYKPKGTIISDFNARSKT